MKLWPAEGVAEIARSVILEAHEDLEDVEIVFLFRSPAAEKNGRVQWGSAAKATSRERALLRPAPRFVITLSHDHWEDMDEDTRRALLDHELSHCELDADDDTGEVKGQILGHDLEEFAGVLARRGAWWRKVRTDPGREAVVRECRQLDLFAVVGERPERKAANL